jgi:rRNA maturation endonuclease Nob1
MIQPALDFTKKPNPVLRCPYCKVMYLRDEAYCPNCGEENLEKVGDE